MDRNNQTTPESPPEKKGNAARSRGLMAIIIIIVVIGVVFGARWLIHRLNYTSTDDAQVNADLIPVSSKVQGRVQNIFVSEGDQVKAGQKIAELDPTDFKLALDKAEAKLESARQDLEKAQSSLELTRSRTHITVLQSTSSLGQVEGGVSISSTQQDINLVKLEKDVERAQINLQRAEDALNEVQPQEEQARTDRDRAQTLYEGGVISKGQWEQADTHASVMKERLAQAEQGKADAEKQLELAQNNLQSATIDKTRLEIARQDREKADLALSLSKEQQAEEVKMAELTVQGLVAHIKELEADAAQAKSALGETTIYSPVDGIVAKKISLSAEIIAPGRPICFVIDTNKMWITANIVEKYLRNFRVGSKASVTIDALPGKTFEGEVTTIGVATNAKFALIPQTNPTGQFIKVAQRVPIKITLSGDLTGLKPGTSAIVSIKNE